MAERELEIKQEPLTFAEVAALGKNDMNDLNIPDAKPIERFQQIFGTGDEAAWRDHLAGRRPLHMEPHSLTRWGVIRTDQEVPEEVLGRVIVVKTDSGSDLYVFATDHVPVESMADHLKDIAAEVGGQIMPERVQAPYFRGDIALSVEDQPDEMDWPEWAEGDELPYWPEVVQGFGMAFGRPMTARVFLDWGECFAVPFELEDYDPPAVDEPEPSGPDVEDQDQPGLPPVIGKGVRNQTIANFGYQLRRNLGLNKQELKEVLQIAVRRCDPPFNTQADQEWLKKKPGHLVSRTEPSESATLPVTMTAKEAPAVLKELGRHAHNLNKTLSQEELAIIMGAVNRARVSPPLAEERVTAIAAQILTKALARKERMAGMAWDVDHLLIWNERSLKPCLANAIVFLSAHPEWKGSLQYDEFTGEIRTVRDAPWSKDGGVVRSWTDQESRLTAAWLQHAGLNVSSVVAHEAAVTVAQLQAVNPVHAYFGACEWDGVPRVERWLHVYFGTVDDAYTRLVGKKLLIAVLARAFRPGSKSDDMVVLEGQQGTYKSQGVEALLPHSSWFSDEGLDPRNKDGRVALRGKLIIEVAEMTVSKFDVDSTKAFLSRRIDRYRPPYDKTEQAFPRTVTFIGTTNKETYLKDETGGRRFLPVKTGRIDLAGIRRDRNLLWAEARDLYRADERWWFDGDEKALAEAEQAARFEPDVWTDTVMSWCEAPRHRVLRPGELGTALLSKRDRVVVDEVLEHCLDKPAGSWDQRDKNRLAGIFAHAGWPRKQARVGEKRVWFYFKLGQQMDLAL